MVDSTLSTLISLYVLIFLFAIAYFNWEKIKDVLLNFKNTKKDKYVKICPQCKSKNVSPDFFIKTFGEKSEFNKYKCNNCGFNSTFFPEVAGRKIAKHKNKRFGSQPSLSKFEEKDRMKSHEL